MIAFGDGRRGQQLMGTSVVNQEFEIEKRFDDSKNCLQNGASWFYKYEGIAPSRPFTFVNDFKRR